jgi:hypothetical protein
VDPQRAAHVFVEIGSRSKDWDPVVRAQLVGAWDAVIKTHDAADLAVGAPKDLVPAVKRRVRKALASQGFEVVAIDAPRWSPDPAVQTALNTLEEARISLQTAETETVKGMAQAAEADAAVQAERDTQWRGLQAILAAQREGAQIQGEAQVEQAREDAADRLRQARAKRAKHIARAQAVRAVTDARVQSLQARVDAARIAGPRMLDEAILKHVLPKLGRRAEPQK